MNMNKLPEAIAAKYLALPTAEKSAIVSSMIIASILLAFPAFAGIVSMVWLRAICAALSFLLMYYAWWLIWIRGRALKEEEKPRPQVTLEQANAMIEELNKQRPKEWG